MNQHGLLIGVDQPESIRRAIGQPWWHVVPCHGLRRGSRVGRGYLHDELHGLRDGADVFLVGPEDQEVVLLSADLDGLRIADNNGRLPEDTCRLIIRRDDQARRLAQDLEVLDDRLGAVGLEMVPGLRRDNIVDTRPANGVDVNEAIDSRESCLAGLWIAVARDRLPIGRALQRDAKGGKRHDGPMVDVRCQRGGCRCRRRRRDGGLGHDTRHSRSRRDLRRRDEAHLQRAAGR